MGTVRNLPSLVFCSMPGDFGLHVGGKLGGVDVALSPSGRRTGGVGLSVLRTFHPFHASLDGRSLGLDLIDRLGVGAGAVAIAKRRQEGKL